MPVADELRKEMRRQNVTVEAAAQHLGVTRNTLTRKLSGLRALTVVEAQALADMLGLSLADLLRRTEPAA